MTRRRKIVVVVLASVAGVFVIAQLVPYGRAHDNPAVTAEPPWDSGATRALAKTACFDCHSNETTWPWYSHVAPTSWLVQHDVDEGRDVLNFSEWNRGYDEAGEAGEAVREGEMPPRIYLLTHPDAKLSATERAQLALGLDRTLGTRSETDAD